MNKHPANSNRLDTNSTYRCSDHGCREKTRGETTTDGDNDSR